MTDMQEHIKRLAEGFAPEVALVVEAVARAVAMECAQIASEPVCDKHIPTGIKIHGTEAAKAIRARFGLE
jgi:hypothetical protein